MSWNDPGISGFAFYDIFLTSHARADFDLGKRPHRENQNKEHAATGRAHHQYASGFV